MEQARIDLDQAHYAQDWYRAQWIDARERVAVLETELSALKAALQNCGSAQKLMAEQQAHLQTQRSLAAALDKIEALNLQLENPLSKIVVPDALPRDWNGER